MTPIPDFVDPRVWAEQSNELAADVGLQYMPRLLASCDAGVDPTKPCVSFSLKFRFDERQRPQVTGNVEANVTLVCQRCLQGVEHTMQSSWVVHPVSRATVERGEWEDSFVFHENDEGQVGVAPLQLVEEEILLSLPLVPMHDACDAGWQDKSLDADEASGEATGKHNPFAVLAGLKSTDVDTPETES